MKGRLTPQATHASLRFRLPLDPARLLRARERIRDYLHQHGVSQDVVDRVVLAVEEAMTNAVRHSGSDALEVRLAFDGRDLLAFVRDEGRGFDAGAFDCEKLPDLLTPGGRGLFLIAHIMDDLELVCEGGLEVRMLKRRARAEPDATLSPDSGIVDAQDLEGRGFRERRLQSVVEELGEGYAALDWDYRFAYVNHVALRIYDATPDLALGRPIWDVFPGIRDTPMGRRIRAALELGSSSILEYRSDRLGRWIELRVYPTASGVSLYLRDVDERKRKELDRDRLFDALCVSEERFRALFDNMTEGVALHEVVTTEGRPTDYRVLDVNPAFERQTGLAAAEVRGRLASEVYGVAAAPYLDEYAGVAGSGTPLELETYFEPMRRHFRITAVPLGAGRFATVFEDVTERRRREAEQRELAAALSRSEESFSVIFEESPFATSLTRKSDGVIKQVNAAFEKLLGCARDDVVGTAAPCFETVDPDCLAAVRALYESDGSVRDFECVGMTKSGDELVLSLDVGTVTIGQEEFVLTKLRDVTAQRRAEEQLQQSLERTLLLQDILLAAAEETDPGRMGDGILRAAHLRLGAQAGDIRILDDQGERLRRLATFGLRGPTPAAAQDLQAGERGSLTTECLRQDRLLTHQDEPKTPERLELIEEAGLAGSRYFVAPIRHSEQTLGAFSLAFEGRRPFTTQELDLFSAVGNVLGQVIAKAQLLEDQRRIALTLQQDFARPVPSFACLEVGLVEAPASQPALAGGDFWDLYQLPGGRVAAVVGDVAGRGVAAAGLTETVRSTMRAFAHVDPTPAFILGKTNEMLLAHHAGELSITALVLVLEPSDGRLWVASAGHPAPVLIADGSASLLEPRYGSPLGSFTHDYASTEFGVSPGDYLLLYTDGVTESRRDGEPFTERRLLETVRELDGQSCEEIAEAVRDAAEQFAGGLRDDLEVLVLRLRRGRAG